MNTKKLRRAQALASLAWVEKAAFLLSGVSISAIAIIVSISAIARYALGISMGWVFEVTQYLLVWFTILPAAWIQKLDRHIAVDVVTSHVSEKLGNWLLVLYYTIGFLVSVIITYFGLVLVIDFYNQGMRETSLHEPLSWPLYVVLPLGFGLLSIQFLTDIVKFFHTAKVSKPKTPGVSQELPQELED